MRGHVGRNDAAQTWYVMYDVPRGRDGKRRQRKKSGFRTEREAERYLNNALAGIESGAYVDGDAGTVQHFLLDDFLPSQGHLRLSTRLTYERYIHRRVVPADRAPGSGVTRRVLLCELEQLCRSGDLLA